MKLSKCLDALEFELRGEDVQINAVEMDSRRVTPGTLFFCIPGGRVDGHDFAAQAVQKGAVALVVERWLEDVSATQVLVPDARAAMARIASNFYGNPTRHLKMIAVTGTNGKTSTTYMIRTIARACGKRVGLLGTIANYIEDKQIDADLTTPDPIALQALLAQMVQENVDWVVMEASAHALYLRKLDGIVYDVAVFSNLTEDHLDFFGDMQRYFAAKALLFTNKMCRQAVVNIDDSYGKRIAQQTDVPCLTYGVDQTCDLAAQQVDSGLAGVSYTMQWEQQAYSVRLPIPGAFTVYNSLAAIGACLCMGLDVSDIVRALSDMHGVHGRCESLDTQGRAFGVILDYAHTPDALENILTTVRKFTKNRLIVVFGCGGDRDPIKRPIMGKMAATYADYCIVTSDNPRTEDPMKIIEAILPGVRECDTPYQVIENRKDAIAHALSVAREGDVIVLAGKGHETYQDIMGVKHHFDEKEVVAQLLMQM
jgi:UDP-N-acetylmuramoyl-L-alanyl-D-glutamate--2,6-diaminopimelate ligase